MFIGDQWKQKIQRGSGLLSELTFQQLWIKWAFVYWSVTCFKQLRKCITFWVTALPLHIIGSNISFWKNKPNSKVRPASWYHNRDIFCWHWKSFSVIAMSLFLLSPSRGSRTFIIVVKFKQTRIANSNRHGSDRQIDRYLCFARGLSVIWWLGIVFSKNVIT